MLVKRNKKIQQYGGDIERRGEDKVNGQIDIQNDEARARIAEFAAQLTDEIAASVVIFDPDPFHGMAMGRNRFIMIIAYIIQNLMTTLPHSLSNGQAAVEMTDVTYYKDDFAHVLIDLPC